MKSIICGAGVVGTSIAEKLSQEGLDVVVIDQSPELINKINENLDVRAIIGHGSNPSILEEAGAADCDILIAVTQIDEVNMVACQIAHTIFKIPTKIARIRQQEYLKDDWATLFAKNNLPIDTIISPAITEKATALSEFNKVVFKVHKNASKDSIKRSVEKMFKVNVIKVNTIYLKGKMKFVRGKKTIKSGYKKAIITLKKGQSIDLTTGI